MDPTDQFSDESFSRLIKVITFYLEPMATPASPWGRIIVFIECLLFNNWSTNQKQYYYSQTTIFSIILQWLNIKIW